MTGIKALRAAALGLAAMVFVGLAGQGLAQDGPVQGVAPPIVAPEQPTTGKVTQLTTGQAPAPETPAGDLNYDEWETVAARAERALENAQASSVTLELVRAQVVDWREAFLRAQNANVSRLGTLRDQISALGPAPAEGETEADEIAARRAELNAQLATLQAPGIAAEEAYRRADGLIREIDRVLRERQADELLKLLPSPLNPANWPEAYSALVGSTSVLMREATVRWSLPTAHKQMVDNLPLIVLLLALALGLIWRGRTLVEAGVTRLVGQSTARGLRVSALVLSLGQILIPTIGAVALTEALKLSGMIGIVGTVVADVLPVAGFTIFALHWLGGRVFPKRGLWAPLPLPDEARAEGRFLSTIFGILLGVEVLREAALNNQALTDAARSVLDFPFLVVAAFVLWRVGRLLQQASSSEAVPGEDASSRSFRSGTLSLLGRLAMAVGIIGPLLGAIGYIAAAGAMIYPAASSLGLIGMLFIFQTLITDVYGMLVRSEDDAKAALVPVLLGFVLVIASIPVFALIWGARVSDITEVWTRLREGFQIGETRISPTDFLVFAVAFGIGLTATRLFQGALKGTILPRTKMDQGAQNAIVSGIGYVGIFLAGLIAINTAGLDLSGLAIVAGALSVGIGFGLQNIVSNFVSGIILLIERPVSAGDWIEVGGVQGVVKSISVRSTRIQTFDRTDVIVPNTDLVAGRVTNWTRFNLTGRLIVPVGVAYGSDTRKVERVLREIAEAQPLALLNPAPMVAFMGFGADSLNFEIRVILRDVNFSLSVRSEINHQIAQKFAEEGIEVPFAQRDITLRNAREIARAFRGEAEPEEVPREAEPDGPRELPRDYLPGEGLTRADTDEDAEIAGRGDDDDGGSSEGGFGSLDGGRR
ncbi:DUF3772 domain-containing protein [Thioclava sp. FR2]|uniref:DUF3772 domain-containing protein n=1 Tax=Thioclava sp. FR2 TaxID=3445780 RepID=UPI003EB77880